jgi:hypothetical protein
MWKATPCQNKTILAMKLFPFLLTACLLLSITAFAQKITLDKSNIPLSEALTSIRSQTGYSVLYDEELLRKAQNVSIHLKDATLEEALKKCFENQPFSYTINNRTILVTPKQEKAQVIVLQVTGKVTDEKALPLYGVTVTLKNSTTSTSTQKDGTYAIALPDGNGVLIFSYVGYAAQEVPVNNTKEINLTMKGQATGLEDVVVVGYGQQKKVSLIGAISTVKAEDLKQPVAKYNQPPRRPCGRHRRSTKERTTWL